MDTEMMLTCLHTVEKTNSIMDTGVLYKHCKKRIFNTLARLIIFFLL